MRKNLYSLLFLIFTLSSIMFSQTCELKELANDLSSASNDFKALVNEDNGFKAWQILNNEAANLRTDLNELRLVSTKLDEITQSGGYLKWKVVSGAGNFAKYTKIRSYLGDGRIKAYLNNQQLLDFENLLKTANDDVLKVMDEFKSADEFAEMVRGYKDGLQLNPSGFADAIKSTETFGGQFGWLKFWRLTPRMENSLNTITQLKSGNKIANVGNATDIQLSSIHAYTANGDFINVPYRYNPTWFGDYNTRAIQHINEGLNELRKIPSRKIVDQTVFSGKTFSKADFESKFVGKNNTLNNYSGYMSTSKLESVAEGFIDLTKQWATGSGEKIAVIQRVTSKNGVYIDDISDWGRNLGKTNHPDPKFINVQVQEEVLLNSQKLKQISEPIPVMVNGVHKTIDGMKVYYVDFIEIL